MVAPVRRTGASPGPRGDMPKKPKSEATRKPQRKLKTYQTSLGFYDQAVAAPSMKAALEAWGASSNLFHQGAAKETDDPDIVAATMASPGNSQLGLCIKSVMSSWSCAPSSSDSP